MFTTMVITMVTAMVATMVTMVPNIFLINNCFSHNPGGKVGCPSLELGFITGVREKGAVPRIGQNTTVSEYVRLLPHIVG